MSENSSEWLREMLENLDVTMESINKTTQEMLKQQRRILSLVQIRQAEKAREEFFTQETERDNERMNQSDQIARAEAQARDRRFIRRSALMKAGIILKNSKEQVIKEYFDEYPELTEDKEVYQAILKVMEAIADEMIEIGESLTQQAHALDKQKPQQ